MKKQCLRYLCPLVTFFSEIQCCHFFAYGVAEGSEVNMATGAKEKGKTEPSRSGMCRWGRPGVHWVWESKGTAWAQALRRGREAEASSEVHLLFVRSLLFVFLFTFFL